MKEDFNNTQNASDASNKLTREQIIEQIMASKELDDMSKRVFRATLEYVDIVIAEYKPFILAEYKSFINSKPGLIAPTYEQFMKIAMLLVLCGYNLSGFRNS